MTSRRRGALAGLLAVLLLAGTAALLAHCPAEDGGGDGESPAAGASERVTPGGGDETSARAPRRPRANVAAPAPSVAEPPSPAGDPLWTPLARDLPTGVLLVRREGANYSYLDPSGDGDWVPFARGPHGAYPWGRCGPRGVLFLEAGARGDTVVRWVALDLAARRAYELLAGTAGLPLCAEPDGTILAARKDGDLVVHAPGSAEAVPLTDRRTVGVVGISRDHVFAWTMEPGTMVRVAKRGGVAVSFAIPGTRETARYHPSPSGELVVVILGVGTTDSSAPPSIESVEVATGTRRRLVEEVLFDPLGSRTVFEGAWSSEGRFRYQESRLGAPTIEGAPPVSREYRWVEVDRWSGTRLGETAWGDRVPPTQPEVSLADHGRAPWPSRLLRVVAGRAYFGEDAEPAATMHSAGGRSGALPPSPDGRFFVLCEGGDSDPRVVLLDGVRRTKREIARGGTAIGNMWWLPAVP